MLISSSLKRLVGATPSGWFPADKRQNTPVKRCTSELGTHASRPIKLLKREGSEPNIRIQDILSAKPNQPVSQFFKAALRHRQKSP